MERIERQIDECLKPFRYEVELLDSIPGVNEQAASSIIAEIGTDMSVFPNVSHLAS